MYISKRYPSSMEYIGETDWEDTDIFKNLIYNDDYANLAKEQVYAMCMRLNILDLSAKHLARVSGVGLGDIRRYRYGEHYPRENRLKRLQRGMNFIEQIVRDIIIDYGEYDSSYFPKLTHLKEYYND